MAANDGDINGEELASGNNVVNEEGKEDMGTYKDISELTNDEIRGLEFDSEEQAIQFYQSFAEFHGFAIRKDYVRRDDDDKIVVRQLVCNRAGKNSKKEGRGKVLKMNTRTDCPARLQVNLNVETDKWTVFAFEPCHNHPLMPTRYVHLIPKEEVLVVTDIRFCQGTRKLFECLKPQKFVGKDIIDLAVSMFTYAEKKDIFPKFWFLPTTFSQYVQDWNTTTKVMIKKYQAMFMGKVDKISKVIKGPHNTAT
ncbi:unnamed protein product [Trifolium pratense]|uniref:Uncharacterized protein n=1 Tax=Trifolium pratense TaxID=57577 RepID=A0ACB0LTU9_TRIPR|nr:unnamed protein product [Trifolium pratense]